MKRILSCLFVSTLLLTGCSSSSFRSALDSLNPSIPEAINQAVSSRVNAENELYTVGSASIGQTGSLIAQSKANKIASEALRAKIKAAVETNFKSYTLNMDSYSKNLVSPAIPELTSYTTDLVIKQVKQKGAWEDSNKVYSLLSVPTSEITSTSQKVLKSFLTNTSKKLEDLGRGI
ncbi:hypothetical protein EGX98_06630 [Fusobacterium necrophorum]|uniref:Lipoprotein n=2 Tax=Fusobacterium necrophorum TaxID=859 RepID=A0AB73BW84_9FUSO|nr:hypothetical protein [Fusobacterium necrophorum]AYZ73719.1 hypothetical protein EGX98_06630 [Fusobacterium necrophorum]AZW08276.1 hypothetical protein EO219_00750 [Fusobacterium necrophorum subsp. necrophorum]KDE63228.1 hypothetical protein FUSO3_05970 [Fusobacterium necrophorum BL]KDE66014.1 hypothetical protein FUSO5_03305 [Fusobacterium necrophorum BFTR-1]KDE66752.1 hypothetical protein FUSO4_04230 [Fusobacterium necrophorum DJ-1]